MDNVPIDTYEDITKYIISCGYRHAKLSSYSPQLNPIKQFWSAAKSKVKRNKYLEMETSMTGINEASNSLKLDYVKGFIWHSHRYLDKGRNKEQL
ncbi:hypothetical protein G6F57_005440 [Rhizopus arrhizus]|uniref:Tc1-like transposase DDE domain-containing protein n=1 Tax=Rhizopus oryzae TaxID=64495 RepID=A0A9P7BZZ7_RHIOR|nr:hypothetical protein G6F23_002677 [Rhizopus arrhizus]KAG1409433.1 hypothetical protein G6F58_009355 [Rhizopus delemar]KAG0760525.1 hypothetical protein G6F24_008248 [Rhizopus arrhizus]KAG0908910.1 hypothetical protein G6F33_009265 [Rhizopus arrhizus]KAG0937329.1 hypothetical protein G6F30_008347 [Rhizopus arrhizus]